MILAGLALLVLLAAGGGAVFLATADLRPFVERQVGDALGRAVAMDDLRIRWGRHLALDMRNVRIGNADWSATPDMIRVGQLSATVDLPALLKGVLRYDHLTLDDVDLLLERKEDGRRNWRFGDAAPSAASATEGGIAAIPKNRRQFPSLLDFALRKARILYRAESRKDIRVALDDLALNASDETSPTDLTVKGSYGDIPIALRIHGGSFAQMRDADTPFDAAFDATSGAIKLAFKGTLTDPLDFDGVDGRLDFQVARFAELLKLFGYERPADYPMTLAGGFHRDGDDWKLEKAEGLYKQSRLTGSFALTEGARSQPDAVTVDAAVGEFDLKDLVLGVSESDPSKAAGEDDELFSPETDPSTTLEARIAAQKVRYGAATLEDFKLAGHLRPGEIGLDALDFGFAGGKVEAKATTRANGAGAEVTVEAAYAGADVGRLTQMMGLDAGLLSGRLDGRMTFAMSGKTFKQALAASEGQTVVVMGGGQIARSLLEKVSLDLRSAFRRNAQTTPVECLVAVIDVKGGQGRVAPLKMRTPEATLLGGGSVALATGQVDLMVKSDPRSTGFFALDLPLHVTGKLNDIAVTPQLGRGPDWLNQPQSLPASLGPEARKLLEGNACLR
ncbi:MAG TPA: AsmA family protein [Alphaproteobacteria bacterium]|jgi:uncharacterized protein involved in outer membrane biogenesis